MSNYSKTKPFIVAITIVLLLLVSTTPSQLTGMVAWSNSAFISEEHYEFDETTHFESRVYVAQDIRLVTLPDSIWSDEALCGLFKDFSSSWDCTDREGHFMENNRFSVDMYLAYQYNLRHYGDVDVRYSSEANYRGEIETTMEIIRSTEYYEAEAKVAFVFEVNREYAPTGVEIQDWTFEIPFPSLIDVDGDGSSFFIGDLEVFTWDQYVPLSISTGDDLFGSEIDLSGYVNLAEIELLELTANFLSESSDPYSIMASQAINALQYVVEIYLTLSLDLQFQVQAAVQTIIDTRSWTEVEESYDEQNERKIWGNYLGFNDVFDSDTFNIDDTQTAMVFGGPTNTAQTQLNILYNVFTEESYSINLEFRPSHRSVEFWGMDFQIGLLAWEILGLSNPIRVPLVDGMLATESSHHENIFAHDRGNIAVPMVPIGDNAIPQVTITGPLLGEVDEWMVFDVQAFDADGDGLFYRYSNGEEQFSDWQPLPFNPRFDHTYQTPGEYVVSIQVRDQYFASEVSSFLITIDDSAPPKALLMVNNTSPRAGEEVNFIWSSENFNLGAYYDINFGDGIWHNVSLPGSITHTFSESGVVYPTLIIRPAGNGPAFSTDIELEISREKDPNSIYDNNGELIIAESDILIVIDSNGIAANFENNQASQNTNANYNSLNNDDAFLGAILTVASSMDWQWNLTVVGDTNDDGITDTWNQDGPSRSVLQKHRVVVWSCGPSFSSTLTTTDQSNIEEYVSGGGRIILFCGDLLYDLDGGTSSTSWGNGDFVNDIFGVETSYQDRDIGANMFGNYIKDYVNPLSDEIFSGIQNIELRKSPGTYADVSDQISGVDGQTIDGMWSTSGANQNYTHAVANYSKEGTQYEGRTVFFSFDPSNIAKRGDLEKILLQTIEWALWTFDDDGTAEKARQLNLGSKSVKYYGDLETTYDSNNPNKNIDWMKFHVARGHKYQITTGSITTGEIYDNDQTTLLHSMNAASITFTAQESTILFLKISTSNSGGSYFISFLDQFDEWSAFNGNKIPLVIGQPSETADDMVSPGKILYSTTGYSIDVVNGLTYALNVQHNSPATDNLTYSWIIQNSSMNYNIINQSNSGQELVEISFTANFTGELEIWIGATGYANSLTFDENYRIEVYEIQAINLADTLSTAIPLDENSMLNGGWLDAEYDQQDWWTFQTFSGERLELFFNSSRDIQYILNATWTSASNSSDTVQFLNHNGSNDMTIQFPHLANGIISIQITATYSRSSYNLEVNELDEKLIESGNIMVNSNGIFNQIDEFKMTFSNDADVLIRAGPSTKFAPTLSPVSTLQIEVETSDGSLFNSVWSSSDDFLSLKIPANSQGVWTITISGGTGGYWLWVAEDMGLAWTTYPQRFSVVEVPFEDTHGAIRQYQSQIESKTLLTTMNYSLDTGPSGMTINSSSGKLSFTAMRSQQGNHPVSVKVTDEWGDYLFQNFTIEVSALPNSSPRWEDFGQGLEFVAGTLGQIQTSAIDDDGDTIIYSIEDGPDGFTIDSNGLIEWKPLFIGTENVTLKVSDSHGLSHSLTMIVVISNIAPIVDLNTTNMQIEMDYSDNLSVQLIANDIDGGTLSWTILSGPNNANINSDGVLMMNPTPNDLGLHEILIMVSDSYGESTIFSVDLNIQRPDFIATSVENSTTFAGEKHTLLIPQTNSISKKMVLISAPEGVQLFDSGYIQWTPTGDQIGTYQIVIMELYEDGVIETININITVENNAPIIIEIGLIKDGEQYLLKLLVIDDASDNVTLICDDDTLQIESLQHGLFSILISTDNVQQPVSVNCQATDSHGTSTPYGKIVQLPIENNNNTQLPDESGNNKQSPPDGVSAVLESTSGKMILGGSLIAGLLVGLLLGSRKKNK